MYSHNVVYVLITAYILQSSTVIKINIFNILKNRMNAKYVAQNLAAKFECWTWRSSYRIVCPFGFGTLEHWNEAMMRRRDVVDVETFFFYLRIFSLPHAYRPTASINLQIPSRFLLLCSYVYMILYSLMCNLEYYSYFSRAISLINIFKGFVIQFFFLFHSNYIKMKKRIVQQKYTWFTVWKTNALLNKLYSANDETKGKR